MSATDTDLATDQPANAGCAPGTGYAPKLYKAASGRKGEHRVPVLLHKDGKIERVKVTPSQWGLLTSSTRCEEVLAYQTGRWASDAGYPKLRWVDAHSAAGQATTRIETPDSKNDEK